MKKPAKENSLWKMFQKTASRKIDNLKREQLDALKKDNGPRKTAPTLFLGEYVLNIPAARKIVGQKEVWKSDDLLRRLNLPQTGFNNDRVWQALRLREYNGYLFKQSKRHVEYQKFIDKIIDIGCDPSFYDPEAIGAKALVIRHEAFMHRCQKIQRAVNGGVFSDLFTVVQEEREFIESIELEAQDFAQGKYGEAMESTSRQLLKSLPALTSILSRDVDQFRKEISYFKWPQLEIDKSISALELPADFNGETFLKQFGYRVGKSSPLTEHQRRVALETLLNAEASHLDVSRDAGDPSSCRRLRRVAYAIAFCILRRSRDRRDYSVAILEWKEDMRYLKRRYYDGRCDGLWPWPTIFEV